MPTWNGCLLYGKKSNVSAVSLKHLPVLPLCYHCINTIPTLQEMLFLSRRVLALGMQLYINTTFCVYFLECSTSLILSTEKNEVDSFSSIFLISDWYSQCSKLKLEFHVHLLNLLGECGQILNESAHISWSVQYQIYTYYSFCFQQIFPPKTSVDNHLPCLVRNAFYLVNVYTKSSHGKENYESKY